MRNDLQVAWWRPARMGHCAGMMSSFHGSFGDTSEDFCAPSRCTKVDSRT